MCYDTMSKGSMLVPSSFPVGQRSDKSPRMCRAAWINLGKLAKCIEEFPWKINFLNKTKKYCMMQIDECALLTPAGYGV